MQPSLSVNRSDSLTIKVLNYLLENSRIRKTSTPNRKACVINTMEQPKFTEGHVHQAAIKLARHPTTVQQLPTQRRVTLERDRLQGGEGRFTPVSAVDIAPRPPSCSHQGRHIAPASSFRLRLRFVTAVNKAWTSSPICTGQKGVRTRMFKSEDAHCRDHYD